MTRFSADTQGEAVVSASRADIWAVLTDPALVAQMTPFVRAITAAGDHWRWGLSGLKVLGAGVAEGPEGAGGGRGADLHRADGAGRAGADRVPARPAEGRGGALRGGG